MIFLGIFLVTVSKADCTDDWSEQVQELRLVFLLIVESDSLPALI